MKLTVTGRHIEITPAIQDHLEERLGKIVTDLEGMIDVHVILSVEKYRHKAEITVKGKGVSFHSEDETKDLYGAIDSTVEKLDKHLKKHRDKFMEKRPKHGASIKDLPIQ